MTNNVRRVTTRSRNWRAWAGTPEDFDKLADLFVRLTEDRRSKYLAEWDIDHPATGDPSSASTSFRDFRREAIVETSEPSLNLWQGNEVARGPVAVVRTELDRRTFRMASLAFTLSDSNQAEQTTIAFMRSERFKDERILGVSLEVKSADREWAASAFAQLSDEIDKSQPSWQFVRSSLARTLLGNTASLGVLLVGAAFNVFSNWYTGIGITLVGLLVNLTMQLNWDRMFPAVEIDPGGGSKTWARVSVIVVTIASVPIGLLVNALSNQLQI